MKTKEITLTAVLIALLIVCSQLVVPIGPIPITLQTLAVLMMGYFLSPNSALLATSLYLLMGVAGLPVLAGFSGGFHVLLTPDFGFVIGFIPASYVQAKYLEKHSNLETKHLFISGFINFLFTYLIGLSYMAIILNIYLNNQMNFVQILMTGLIPFIPGDLIKLAVAVLLAKQILPVIQYRFSPSE